MNEMKEAADVLSVGNLEHKMNYHAKNEFGQFADRLNFSFHELKKYVDAIGETMKEFANKNFDVESGIKFRGDFEQIQTSIISFRNQTSGIQMNKSSQKGLAVCKKQTASPFLFLSGCAGCYRTCKTGTFPGAVPVDWRTTSWACSSSVLMGTLLSRLERA